MRLALLYALLDGRDCIGNEQLEAGLEVWRYCEDSTRFLFGDALGDATADRIRGELQHQPQGMSRNEIREVVFRKNKPSTEIARALELLLSHGMARKELIATSGRSEERWFATTDRLSTSSTPLAATR